MAAFRTRVRPRGTGFWEPGNVPPSPARGRSRALFPGRLQASLLGQCAEVDAAGRILGDIGSVSVPTACCCRWTSNERRGRGAERGEWGARRGHPRQTQKGLEDREEAVGGLRAPGGGRGHSEWGSEGPGQQRPLPSDPSSTLVDLGTPGVTVPAARTRQIASAFRSLNPCCAW